MAASAKTRAKRHAHIKKSGWMLRIPKWNSEKYTLSLMKLLTFLSVEVTNEEKQSLVISYWESQSKTVTGLAKLSSGYFSQAAAIVVMLQEEIQVKPEHITYLDRTYRDTMAMVVPATPVTEKAKVVAPVKDKTPELAAKVGAEIDAEIDKVFASKGTHSFDVKEFLVKSKTPTAAISLLPGFYEQQLAELKEVPTGDDQLKENYQFLGKVGLKRVIAFFEGLLKACDTAKVLVKTTRKPRVKKEKPASVQVSKIKFLKEDIESGMRSITPEKIIGADEVWVYNVQYRRLFKYIAQEGMKLAVKGTSLQNFDPEKSFGMTIRKPDVFFKDLLSQTKRAWSKAFSAIRGAGKLANGRVNDQTLILKAF